MKIQTLCFLVLFMLALKTVSGLRVKKQAGICAAAGVPAVSTDTIVEGVEEVVEQPHGLDEIITFVEETTVATPEEVAELVNEVAHTKEEAQELTELISEVVHVVEVEEQEISTETAVDVATEIVEGHHNNAEVVNYIEETTVATPEEIAEFVNEVTTNPHQAEELTEVLYETIEVVETPQNVFDELHEEVEDHNLPPVETHVEEVTENGEATWAVGEPLVVYPETEEIYYYEEAERVERPEEGWVGGEGSLPPVWTYGEGSIEQYEERIERGGEEATERPEMIGGHSLPPVWVYEEGSIEHIERPELERPEEHWVGGEGSLPPVQYEERVERGEEVTENEWINSEDTWYENYGVEGEGQIAERPEMIGEHSLPPVHYEQYEERVERGGEEATERPEMIGGHSLPPVQNDEPIEERIERGGEENTERPEMVGGPDSIPPWLQSEESYVYIPGTIEAEVVTEVLENPVAVEEVVNFVEETTVATPEEVAELIHEVSENPHQAEELAELIAEVVEIVEVEEQQISTETAVDVATEIVEGHHNSAEVVNFIEETTVATPEEIAEFVAEVTTNPYQAEELTEVLYETIEVVETEARPLPEPVYVPPMLDEEPAFCH